MACPDSQSLCSLDETVVRLPCFEPNSYELELTGRDLCSHTVLTGSTGSGKTSVLNHFIRDLISFRAADDAARIGLLVIDAKSDDTTPKVRHWAKAAGREDDLVVIDGEHQGFRIFDRVETTQDVEDAFSLIQAAACEGHYGSENAYWEQTSLSLIESICKACYLDDQSTGLTTSSLIDMFRLWGVDRGSAEFMRLSHHLNSKLKKASESLSPSEVRWISSVIAEMETWRAMDPKTATILVTILDHTSQPMSKGLNGGYLRSEASAFHFREIFEQGKIVVLKLDSLVRPEVSGLVGRLAKSIFYMEAQKRTGGEHSGDRMVGVIADEYPLIATGGHRRFSDIPQLQTLRSKRTFFVAASQGLSNLFRVIGTSDTTALTLNFNNLFFFNTTETSVEEWARLRLGRGVIEGQMDIESSSEPDGGNLQEIERRSRHRFQSEGWILPQGGLGRLETLQAYVSTRGNANEHKLLWFAPLYPPPGLTAEDPSPATRNLRQVLMDAVEATSPEPVEEKTRPVPIDRLPRLSDTIWKIMCYAGHPAIENPDDVERVAASLPVHDRQSVGLFDHLQRQSAYQISGAEYSGLPAPWKLGLFHLIDPDAIRSGLFPILNTLGLRDGLCLIDFVEDEDWSDKLERVKNGDTLSPLGRTLVYIQLSLYPTVFRPLKPRHRLYLPELRETTHPQ